MVRRRPAVTAVSMTEHQDFLDATLPHLDAVWNVARRMAPDPSLVEDLVQDTYLRAFAGFATQRDGQLRSWLVAICANAARDAGRRRQRRPEECLAVVPEASLPTDDAVGDAAANKVDAEGVIDALDRLPLAQRQAIVLVDVAGLTFQEAADALGAPRGTVLARVHRGRRRLAALLESKVADRGV